MSRRWSRGAPVLAPALVAVLLVAEPAAVRRAVVAQDSGASGARGGAASELDRLREAGSRESAGDLAGAERIVREVLQANPSSLTALLGLERLLNAQGRPDEVLPVAERLIRLDPRSVIGHQIRLRVLAAGGSPAAIEAAVAAWTDAMPQVETPYREAALVWRQRGDMRRSTAVLEAGRRRIARSDALALELGDAYAAAGDARRAAAEWARAVGSDGRGFMLVQRRLHEQPDGGARLMPLLIDQLAEAPRTPGRQRAATLLAIEARQETKARQHARTLAELLGPADREALFAELARRSDHAGLHGLAAWAYGELLDRARDPDATLALRSRMAELALLAGDTARAAAAYGELERAAAVGSPQRSQAVALRIQMTAREGDLGRAAAELYEFRAEFPQATELDATAALVATLYLEAGDAGSAERVLAGVSGARSAQLRGRMAIRAGELAEAGEELLSAAGMLRGAEATETLALAALLMRIGPRGGELLARYVGAQDADREAFVRDAIEQTRGLVAAERAAVLDFVAAAADRDGLHDDAEAARREIIDALPRSHEAAGALLMLARRALARPDGGEEAKVLLERLIVDYPRSTLAPQARQELQRLRTASPTP